MKKIYLLLCLLFSINLASAEKYSMRDCMILPIVDGAGNSLGFKVYEELENYLKTEKWCHYKSSAEILNIFSKYRDRLSTYLQDPNVIRTAADRLQVGTLIRVELEYDVDKMKIKLDILGEDGQDIYLSEKTVIPNQDPNIIVTTIKNWLELYEAQIPYDGKVLGILGEQVTFTFPASKKVSIGQEFRVSRLKNKKKHPLLKKIVEWDSVTMARGKVFNLSQNQTLGLVKVYMTEKALKPGDWIRLEKMIPSQRMSFGQKNIEQNSFGRLGEATISFILSKHSTTGSVSTSNKLGGLIYGISVDGQIWLTRNYFALGEFSRKVGGLEKENGSPNKTSSGQNTGTLKIGGGFKYLPMGFFYGPQLDIYGGYSSYTYATEKSASDGFGSVDISGIMLGIGGSIPMKKGFRLFGSGEIIPFGEAKDEDNITGSNKSISSMAFEIGGRYFWSPAIRLQGSVEIINNNAKFNGNVSEMSFSDTSFKLGGVFSF